MKDYFGADACFLKKKKLFLFDMDGTIYEENRLFDGVLELLELIKKNGGNYVFVTNNSSKSVDDYIKKVNSLGISANKDNFFTSVQASVLLLQDNHPTAKVYCQGTESLINELINSGINVTQEVCDDIEVVLVGYDTELTYDKLNKTCRILTTKDVHYYATNCDLRCPISFGYVPDCGSICEMIKKCTEKEPIYIGKPEAIMIYSAMKSFGADFLETVVIGDRLYTDIASGINAGVSTVCVLTGEATINDIINGDIKPTFTFESVKDMLFAIKY